MFQIRTACPGPSFPGPGCTLARLGAGSDGHGSEACPPLLSRGQEAFCRLLRLPQPPPALSWMETLSPIHSAFKGLLSEPGSRRTPSQILSWENTLGPCLDGGPPAGGRADSPGPLGSLPTSPRPTSETQAAWEGGRTHPEGPCPPAWGVALTPVSLLQKTRNPFYFLPLGA